MTGLSSPIESESGEPTFFDRVLLLWAYRKALSLWTILGSLAGLILSLFFAKVYESSTVLISRERPPLFKPLASSLMLGNLGSEVKEYLDQLLPNLEVINAESTSVLECVAILKSKAHQTAILQQLKLAPANGPLLSSQLRAIDERTTVTFKANEPTIRVTVRWSDPEIAATIANQSAKLLADTIDLRAKQRREQTKTYIERQLKLLGAKESASQTREPQLSNASTGRTSLPPREDDRRVINLQRLLEYLQLENLSDVPAVETLDPALPSDWEVFPRKSTFAFSGLACGALIGIVFILLIHHRNSLKPTTTPAS